MDDNSPSEFLFVGLATEKKTGGIEIYWPEGKVKYKRKGDVLNFRDVDSLINLQTLHPPKLQINDKDIWGKINLSSLVPSLPALIEYV